MINIKGEKAISPRPPRAYSIHHIYLMSRTSFFLQIIFFDSVVIGSFLLYFVYDPRKPTLF